MKIWRKSEEHSFPVGTRFLKGFVLQNSEGGRWAIPIDSGFGVAQYLGHDFLMGNGPLTASKFNFG